MVNSIKRNKKKPMLKKTIGGNIEAPIRIAVLSQNSVSQNSLESLDIEDINHNVPDIYLEMTQEDKTNIFESRSINRINDYRLLCMESLLKVTKLSGFNVRTKVFVKNSFSKKIDVLSKGSIPLKSTPYFLQNPTIESLNPLVIKGAVYVKLKIEGYPPIMLVNAHLPMLKIKDAAGRITDDLGSEFRKESLKTLLKQLVANGLDDKTTLFLGGDLNFRVTLDGKDQLTEFLKTPVLEPRLTELDFVNEEDKIFTCKFQTEIPEDNEGCRNTKVPESIDSDGTDKSAVTQYIKTNVQDVCGVVERFPSRCDRFLVSIPVPSLAKIDVVVHKGRYFPEMVSDHNALYAVFDFSSETKQVDKKIFRFKNGDEFEGEMDDDGKMKGHGIWRFADGLEYEGDWIDGRLHGKVLSKSKDGEVSENLFENGEFIETISKKRGGKKSRRRRRLTRKQK